MEALLTSRFSSAPRGITKPLTSGPRTSISITSQPHPVTFLLTNNPHKHALLRRHRRSRLALLRLKAFTSRSHWPGALPKPLHDKMHSDCFTRLILECCSCHWAVFNRARKLQASTSHFKFTEIANLMPSRPFSCSALHFGRSLLQGAQLVHLCLRSIHPASTPQCGHFCLELCRLGRSLDLLEVTSRSLSSSPSFTRASNVAITFVIDPLILKKRGNRTSGARHRCTVGSRLC